MATLQQINHSLSTYVLDHILTRIELTEAEFRPFAHIYLDQIFPWDVYEQLLYHLPDPSLYRPANEKHYGRSDGGFVRSLLELTTDRIAELPWETQEFWSGVTKALTAPELKDAMFAKLAPDLAFRYGVPEREVKNLAGYTRPTLYRETDGYEIPPHPDTRRKVVTMQLYLPADDTQLDLGTALYRRRISPWPFGNWRNRFAKVKQFEFRPNSGYAFVVNNTLTKKSWHGREELPPNSGVRNTLLNTFYDTQREGF
jgi:hypothetical protein